jgi:hypothetical protein
MEKMGASSKKEQNCKEYTNKSVSTNFFSSFSLSLVER